MKNDLKLTGRGWVLFSMLFSISALIISVYAILQVISFNSPKDHLSNYDFTSPESAFLASKTIENTLDVDAMRQLAEIFLSEEYQELLDTFSVSHRQEYGGKKLLFAVWKINGWNNYEVIEMSKDVDSGFWRFDGLAYTYAMEDSELEDKITKWRSRTEEEK